MLSICKVPLGGEDYYLRTAGAERAGLVEAAGSWLGSGAEHLGLIGQAEPDAVRLLLAGVHPDDGELLLPLPERRRVAAYDCTFSTPKSVSILYALHPDPDVREHVRRAHESAVWMILQYLERVAIAVGLRTADGPRVVWGGEMVAVGFLHRLSRAGDPHLHTHVLVANLVRDPSGEPERGRPLDARGLFHETRTACALFETHLRSELTLRLGVEWQPLRGWWADLKGIDAAVIGEFSQRREQILDAVTAEGLQGRAATRLMADVTRPPKDLSVPYEEVIEQCWERAYRVGLSEARVVGVCGRVAGPPELDATWKSDALDRAALLSEDGSFTEHDLIRATCTTARAGRSVADVLNAATELAADERVVARGERALALKGPAGALPLGRSEPRYMTQGTADAEDRLLAVVAGRSDEVAFVGYASHERVEALDSLSLAAAAWKAEGREVVAVAPGRFSAAGFEAASGIETIVRLGVPSVEDASGRGRLEPRSALPVGPGSVVVLAEVQCYGPVALEEIMQACEARGAAVVLFGSQRAMERRPALGEVAALADGRLPAAPSPPSLPVVPSPPSPHSSYSSYSSAVGRTAASPQAPAQWFGGVDVTIVPSLGAALDEAVRRLVPGAALLVTADQALVTAVRACPGIEAGDVVHACDVERVLTARADGTPGPPPHLVVLGGASVLRKGATAAAGVERSHILVAPGVRAGSAEALGWDAEAARPFYLTKALGTPGALVSERDAWRRGATLIETHRLRFGIADLRNPFGLEHGTSERAGDRAGVQQALQAERSSLGRGIEGRSLGLGR